MLMGHCSSLFVEHRSLFITFFLAGLTGGFTHCVSMCGPFVACQATCRTSLCSSKKSLMKIMGFPYHIGRATTYGALGFISAYIAKQIAYSPYWPWISAAMLVIAGTMFLVSSLPGCKHSLLNLFGKLTYMRGVLLGFMPCGLLYAALMMAATTASPLSGMFAMWLFVLGTIPALLLTNLGVRVITNKWQENMQKLGRVVMAFNGVLLFIMAINLVR